ncbi:membrane protein [Stutzerimonas stutzeri]|uniref:Membrane protein n=1 Tax=Stutzerimonas stutzeri TaxID=316 RepID=W8QTN5_STUST|nr:OmpA family protein [Stutzerimonas stutzeri]AHL73930.1 membrane protein [Stutzerimonas stutzeri]MCQ4328548.1 OmpA family protein [Stutzerimonas stutzeri]
MRPTLQRLLTPLCLALMSGCATGNYVVLLESPDGTTGAVVIDDAKGQTRLDRKQQGAKIGATGFGSGPFDVGDFRISHDFSAALAAQPLLPQRFELYFKIGSAELTEESEQAIEEVFETIRLRGRSAVSVIGHTDTLSGPRWNEQLGLIRAQAVAAMLRKRQIDVIDLKVSSHGERNLLIKTPDGVSEPRNRRVEISVR